MQGGGRTKPTVETSARHRDGADPAWTPGRFQRFSVFLNQWLIFMSKEWLDVLVGPVHAILILGLISQSEYYSILQASKDSASALGGQYNEQKTMRPAPCVTAQGKGGVVVIGKSAPELGRHLPWAGFVGGFQLVLNITLVTPLHSKIVWTTNWPAIARPNAHDYTKKCFGNWICNNFWSDSIENLVLNLRPGGPGSVY